MKTLVDFVKDIDIFYDKIQERTKKDRDDAIAKAETSMLFLQEANSLGFIIEEPKSFYGLTSMTIDVKDQSENPKWAEEWRIIKQIVGNLKEAYKEPLGNDARKRMVKVTLTPEDKRYEHITFRFNKKLPAKSKSKCKVVRVRPASYLTMVCEE